MWRRKGREKKKTSEAAAPFEKDAHYKTDFLPVSSFRSKEHEGHEGLVDISLVIPATHESLGQSTGAEKSLRGASPVDEIFEETPNWESFDEKGVGKAFQEYEGYCTHPFRGRGAMSYIVAAFETIENLHKQENGHLFKFNHDRCWTPHAANEVFASNFIRAAGKRITAPKSRRLTREEATWLISHYDHFPADMGTKFEIKSSTPEALISRFHVMEFINGDTLSKFSREEYAEKLNDEEFLLSLGEIMVLDLLLGNFDRVGEWLSSGNIIFDQSGKLYGIDQALSLGGMDAYSRMAMGEGPFGQKMYSHMHAIKDQLNDPDQAYSKKTGSIRERHLKLYDRMRELYQSLIEAFFEDKTHPIFQMTNLNPSMKTNGEEPPVPIQFHERQRQILQIGMIETMLRLSNMGQSRSRMPEFIMDISPMEFEAFMSLWNIMEKELKAFKPGVIEQMLKSRKAEVLQGPASVP